MNRKLLMAGLALGIVSIIFGALGAHGLKQLISGEQLQSFEVGVRYQIYQAFFLIFLGTTHWVSEAHKKIVFWLVLVGVLFFSGSIYGLATADLSGIPFKTIAFITPIGGLLLILAWFLSLISVWKRKEA